MAVTLPRMMETFSNSISAGLFMDKFSKPILPFIRLKEREFQDSSETFEWALS